MLNIEVKKLINLIDNKENYNEEARYDKIVNFLKHCKIQNSEYLNKFLEAELNKNSKFKEYIIDEIIKRVKNKDLIKPSEKILKIAFDDAITVGFDSRIELDDTEISFDKFAIAKKSNSEMMIVVNLFNEFKLKPTTKMIDWAKKNHNSDQLADFILDVDANWQYENEYEILNKNNLNSIGDESDYDITDKSDLDDEVYIPDESEDVGEEIEVVGVDSHRLKKEK